MGRGGQVDELGGGDPRDGNGVVVSGLLPAAANPQGWTNLCRYRRDRISRPVRAARIALYTSQFVLISIELVVAAARSATIHPSPVAASLLS
eukprot:COSAG02_NODE_40678_length_402_cov_1.353135_1_plen_92_part_00